MAFNTTEQEIIKFGASNGKSRAEVEQAISNYRAGVVPTPKVVEQPESSVVSTYGKNLKEQFMGGVENAQKTLGYGVDTMQQAQQIPLDTKANKDRAIVTGIAGAGQVGAGAASGVVQTVFSPLTAAVTTGFSELNKATGGKMTDQITKIAQSNPELVQSISDYVTQNPKKVQFASDMLNILTAGLGGKAVGEVTKDIAKGVTTGIKESVGTAPTSGLMTESVGKLLSKANPTEAQAISNTYKGIMDVVENKKSLLQSFKKSEGSGKDPISLIAENPDYMVRINQEAKTIDANDSIANMRRDIADFSTVRDSLLATADETLPAIPTDKIIRDAITKFSAKNYSTYLDEGEKAVKDIVTKLQTLKKYNPQTVTRVEINNIRKGLDETINSFTDTKLKDRMRADLRSVFKTNLEQSIPESGLLSDLNAKIGDLLDASKFLETKLNGTKVKGGGLTDLAMKATGASIGATGLGGAMGGIPGAAAGYYLSDFISKTLIKNAINNPFDRAILDKLKSIRPDVVKRAEDYINQTTTKTTTTGQTELLKGVQPSTQSTPVVPKSKGIRGFVNPGELFAKNPAKINNIVSKLSSGDIKFLQEYQDAYYVKKLTKEMKERMDNMLGEMKLTAKNGDEAATIAQLLSELKNSKK